MKTKSKNIKNFEEYKKIGEPDKAEKARIWGTAIGLQKADNLETSEYLIQTAHDHIDGKISIAQAKKRINDYYETQEPNSAKDRTEEADKASTRIAEILGEKTFKFSIIELKNIHRRLFEGITVDGKHIAGRFRSVNITKNQNILDGDSVFYGSASNIPETLEYDFDQEKKFDYSNLDKISVAKHIARFTAAIWQVHPFREGNTRTVAVFIIKYLRTFGFDINNDLFEEHSEYFRNALVRANYRNAERKIAANFEYLDRFFENLLLGADNKFDNEDLDINTTAQKTTQKSKKTTQKILDALKDNPHITRKELAEAIGLSEDGIKWNLNKLRDTGAIKRIGPDKGGHWAVTNG